MQCPKVHGGQRLYAALGVQLPVTELKGGGRQCR